MLNLLKRNKKKDWNIEEGNVITEAFRESDGRIVYKMNDLFNSFCFRAQSALHIYGQWELRKTVSEDKAAWQRVVDICNKQPIIISDVIRIALDNLEKHDLILPPQEIVWQMASVAYFDESESPYKYDEEYGKKKIARWKEDKKVDFFLSKNLLGNILPLPDLSKIDLENYFKVQEMLTEKHGRHLLGLS